MSEAKVEPTEQEKQEIFDWLDTVDGADTDIALEQMEKKFPKYLIDWFTETMMALPVGNEEK
jgi:hypothetical protein